MPSKQELLDLQFIDARHMLINLAAFLDRIDRHPGTDDYRFTALKTAIPILLSPVPTGQRPCWNPFQTTARKSTPAPLSKAHSVQLALKNEP